MEFSEARHFFHYEWQMTKNAHFEYKWQLLLNVVNTTGKCVLIKANESIHARNSNKHQPLAAY